MTRGGENDLVAVLPKIVLASLVAYLPMLGLLLVPQLVRSRAGSETLLLVGSCLLVAWLMPYVSDNPRFGAPDEPRWILHYRNYAIQALVIYFFSCLSFAWLGARLR